VDHLGDQISVYVVNPAGKLEIRRVTLGIQTATHAEVLSGLQEGEMVVVSDRSGLKAGQEVRPKVIELVEYQNQEDKQ
jgi:multidrug efflux pump subunit AcrA (membrane-fusion protein)